MSLCGVALGGCDVDRDGFEEGCGLSVLLFGPGCDSRRIDTKESRIGALISCLDFRACSFVLPPYDDGRYGGKRGGGGIWFSVSGPDAEFESEETLIVSWLEVITVIDSHLEVLV